MCGVLALALCGCGASKFYRVGGRVVDCESEQPLRLAEVSIALKQQGDRPGGVQVRTNASGEFTAYVGAWPRGAFAYLRVTKSGYIETEEELGVDGYDNRRICLPRTPGM